MKTLFAGGTNAAKLGRSLGVSCWNTLGAVAAPVAFDSQVVGDVARFVSPLVVAGSTMVFFLCVFVLVKRYLAAPLNEPAGDENTEVQREDAAANWYDYEQQQPRVDGFACSTPAGSWSVVYLGVALLLGFFVALCLAYAGVFN